MSLSIYSPYAANDADVYPERFFDRYEDAGEDFCEMECGAIVAKHGQSCDTCLVANAEACGDWDEESLAAAERIKAKA